ncbi:MAG: carboxypeptidase-like regulatory domain-containing protein, partial [Bryobacteraceae bacterium]
MGVLRGRWTVWAVVAILTAVLTGSASAQQVFGSIYGTITDASGAAVANAKITISDPAKGTTSEVTTDAAGNYRKGQLIPDTYKVTIEAPGFQKVVSSDIVVEVDASARFDAALKVGDVTTEVEVTAAAPLLQTASGDVAQTFTSKEVTELPNIGRNIQSMELLEPGSAKMGWQHASDENPQGSVQMVVDGQLFSAMGYELDGTTNQDPILGIIVINPTMDSLSEIKQALQNFDAEFSYVGGGVASYSTKSGSNEFHGDAFEYLQLNTPGFTSFAANPFTGLPAATYRQNQFGGSISGPIIKDRLFFFGDAQLNRQSQGGSVVTSVPTALNRIGNFSDYLTYGSNYQIYNPNTGNLTTGVGRTPYAGNVIPTSQLSPQALALLQYFPLPNYQALSATDVNNNYSENGAVAITGNLWNTREDYYINAKNTLFGRYSYASYTEAAPGAFGELAGGPTFVNYAGNSQALNQSLAIGWTDTISPTLINEFRFGWMKYHVFDTPNGYGTQPALAAGIPGLNLDKTYTSGMPYFNITSPNDSYQLGYALGVNQCNCPLTQTETQYQFVDNATKVIGKHSIKFGADLRWAQNLRVPSDSHRAGELTFNGTNTGNVPSLGASASPGIGLATFMLGDVSSFQRYVSTSTNAQERQHRLFWYGQDEYRPTSKLTVTIGLRWEMIFPESVNAAGNGSTLNLSNGDMYVFGVGGVSNHGIQNMNWHNFA